jgi:hypothetical protein
MQCSNNLKQLGLAAHNFHDVHRKFPPGVLSTPPRGAIFTPANSDTNQYIGTLPYLLPYMELNTIRDKLPDQLFETDKFYPAWWKDVTAFTLAQTKIGMFLCPSIDANLNTVGTACTLHTYIDGTQLTLELNFFDLAGGGMNLGRTNYLGCAGVIGNADPGTWKDWEGVFSVRTKHSFATVLDGTSHTLLFGEVTGGNWATPGTFEQSFSWMGSGAMATAWGLDYSANPNQRPGWFQFGSTHSKLVQFCFVDGSVRRVSTGVQFQQFLHVSGMRDGQVLTEESLQ